MQGLLVCDGGKRSIGGHSTEVVGPVDEQVAIVAPVGGPGVLDEPIVEPIQSSIPDRQHLVIKVSWSAACR